jgi:hypothetical protein
MYRSSSSSKIIDVVFDLMVDDDNDDGNFDFGADEEEDEEDADPGSAFVLEGFGILTAVKPRVG